MTDLPEPVAPAISICGIFARSATIGVPETSRPRTKVNGLFSLATSGDCNTSLSLTVAICLFGISTPTALFPGIGASIRIG